MDIKEILHKVQDMKNEKDTLMGMSKVAKGKKIGGHGVGHLTLDITEMLSGTMKGRSSFWTSGQRGKRRNFTGADYSTDKQCCRSIHL